MTKWTQLSIEGVGGWLAEIMSGPAPPAFPLILGTQEPKVWESLGTKYVIEPDDRSGVPVLSVSGSVNDVWPVVTSIANDVDLREHVRVDENEIRTRIDGIDVIGPGGRLLILRQLEGLRAEIVLRHRGAPRSGVWRPRRTLLELLGTAIDDPSSITIEAAFGYFEASRFVRQTILRPAVVFALSNIEAAAPWAEHVVLAATEGDGDGELEDAMSFVTCA